MLLGEIWYVSLPFAGGGHEQSGQRPALVLQDAAFGHTSPLVVVAPLTSQLAALRFPASIRLDPTPQNGLAVPSVVMGFQIRALDRSRFASRCGKVSDADLQVVQAKTRQLLGLK